VNKPSTVFRQEAVAALDVPEHHGAPLHLVPGWTKVAYWFVVAIVVGAVVFASLAFVSDYAEGPAVVRVDGRLDLTTQTGGTAMDVAVQQGAHVVPGQVLVRFYSGMEQQELDHTNREFDLTLIRLLQDPTNEGARQALASLRAQRELALARIRTRTVVAPGRGVVASVRVRPGQSLAPGDVVATLLDESAGSYSVVALVPGQYRPALKAGMPLRLELDGYPRVYARMSIESIGDEAVGPTEVRRYLGEEVADTLAVQGSLVLVRAHLKEQTFVFDGKSYRYYDGIPGRVDVPVRQTRLIVLLLPVLREVFAHGSRA
jgi:multidrug efflux pump subunit AcrA (membrane-fusion protein)